MGSILASLLAVGVTALIFDEVIARQRRRERATSVAVQAMILYAQARRAFGAILAGAARHRARAVRSRRCGPWQACC